MRVKATKQGFHGKLREVGDEFDVAEGEKASWFVPKDEVKKESASRQAPASAGGKGKQAPASATTESKNDKEGASEEVKT